MRPGADPYAVLGVARGATDAAIHAGYRAAVRRTHPDTGGSAAAFEEVQEAYELLRDPAPRRAWDAGHPVARPRPAPARSGPGATDARRALDELLAESERLEAQARDLAGMRPRHGPGVEEPEGPQDSLGAVWRDAREQLRGAAEDLGRDLRRLIDRIR